MLRGTSLLTTQRTMASVLYLALLVSLSCVLWNGADAECDRPCPTGWSKYGNQCFLFQDTQKDWASAEVQSQKTAKTS
ncbi:PREDICTED: galactose-specific lectin nattectin-like [Poecilia mexicana]|uniref:galactose-specific lectin nattectin-like n=1 Tax=Poecilia mexicana TaxID=48701 RepID=UPI00072DCD26|nr:PREDICTED: galactose-specific lectin nattectin-like [Poecilia mexicana]